MATLVKSCRSQTQTVLGIFCKCHWLRVDSEQVIRAQTIHISEAWPSTLQTENAPALSA